MSDAELRVLAERCHTSSCCPAILESPDGQEVVIVGSVASALLSNASVQKRIGADEVAIVIPKSLIIEALDVMKHLESDHSRA